MARQRHAPQLFRRSPAQPQRVTRGRNAKNAPEFTSPIKHKKGPVLDKESLVRSKLQKQLAHKPIATPLTDSDDSDRLVTMQKRAGKVQKPIYASGGVAQGDTPGSHLSRKRKSMENGFHEESSAEKRLRTGQGSGLKRPSKFSLGAPPASIPPNATLSSSPAGLAQSSPKAVAALASSAIYPDQNSSIFPTAEASIIGTLKPRKRQPSILQIIETNDSSRLTAEDENRFLPDDESTPLPLSKTTAATSSPKSTSRRPDNNALSSSGLMRPVSANKQRTPLNVIGANDYAPLSSPRSSPHASPQLAASVATKHKTTKSTEEESVMAPPMSSSPTTSPPRSKSQSALNKVKKPTTTKPVSMEALQSMMPRASRRPRRQQQQQVRCEFDISEDSGGSQAQPNSPSDKSNTSPWKPPTTAGRRRKQTQTQTQTARHNRRGSSVLSSITTNSKISKNVRGAGWRLPKDKGGGGGARHLGTISRAKGRGTEKENTTLPGGLDDELQRIRHQFAEVDDWAMEFEDVEVLDRSSQEGFR